MNRAQAILLLLFAILIAEQNSFPFEQQPVLARKDIKAARDKFDREMKLNARRPWDGMDLTGPHT
jgi:hypothetical protein